jgi:hypothetical protein
MLHLNFSGWLSHKFQKKRRSKRDIRGMEAYLTKAEVYLPSGVISTPPSTAFDIWNTANACAIASHTVVSASSCPMHRMSFEC